LLRALPAAAFCCAVGTLAILGLGIRGAGTTTGQFSRWPFIDMWIRWDAGWYQAVATVGYFFSSTEQSTVAYFPAYPALIRLGVALGANPFIAGMVITFLCGLAALVVFRAWCLHFAPEAMAGRAQWIVALWPFAYYLYGAVYSDALFMALVIGAFLCLERGRAGWGALLGAVATATRPVAPAVVLGLWVRHIELRRRAGKPWGPADLIPLLSGLGAAGFMAYLFVRFHDPLAFLTTQAGWSQAPGSEWLGKFGLTLGLLRSPHPEDAALPLFHLALAVLHLVLGYAARRRFGWGYTVYVWVVLALPLIASRDYISLGRYALAAFPGFLILAEWLAPRRIAWRAWLAASVTMLGWMVSRFAMGHYVA
jgi:hypothetical protein